MGLRVSGERVVGVEPLQGHPVSRGQLCTKGWNTAFAIDPINRIRTPLIKEADGFRNATWDEALDYVANTFRSIIDESGPDALGVVSCARATNEDNYSAQKFARCVVQTNNVDHCARICHSPSVAGLRQTLGSGAMTNSAEDVFKADLLVIWGCDPTENHSIIGSHIMRAKLGGTKLIVVDPRKIRLARMADLHLQLRLGTNIALINGLLNIIFEKGWEDREFLSERCEGVEELKSKVAEYPPEKVSQITGVSVADMREAARLYSHASAAFLAYGMGITQYTTGTNNVISISNLCLTCGQIGRPGSGINPLRGQNNVQGACDMGALPDVYPGYQSATEKEVQDKFAKAWAREVGRTPGLTSLGMTKGALEGRTRAMIIMGEDPVVTDPDQNHVSSSLKALDFLVVFEMVMTETAKYADVIFPVASFAEKEGTFTNCERRVQHVRPAIPPAHDSKPDWWILGQLAKRLGYEGMNWENSGQIFDELCILTPMMRGMSYPGIDENHGLQWPCNTEHAAGTEFLHHGTFTRGKGRLIPINHQEPSELPDEEYPLALTTQRLHFHYGCGSMTRKSPLLERETPDGILYISPEDAATLGLRDHSPVRVSSRRGRLETRAVVTDEVPAGTVSMPYHFKETPSNQLTNNAQDPVTNMPELKICAVRVDALPEGTEPRTMDQILEEGSA